MIRELYLSESTAKHLNVIITRYILLQPKEINLTFNLYICLNPE